MSRTVYIATRGSALALAQSNLVLDRCRGLFPELQFELKIIKTTGDKLQTAALMQAHQPPVEKGLFTKELEIALLAGEADFAVHSLKDLPTDLPDGLELSAVSAREDVRDVLIYRDAGFPAAGRGFHPALRVADLPSGTVIATSSTRRQAQLQAIRPDLKTVPIRGNVGTRMQKLRDNPDLDGIVLALAGLKRLAFQIEPDSRIAGNDLAPGLLASILPLDQMLPCIGQAALGFESRVGDPFTGKICAALNDSETLACVTAERSFLRAMGGGCLSPVAALAELSGGILRLRAISFHHKDIRHIELQGSVGDALALGARAAATLQ